MTRDEVRELGAMNYRTARTATKRLTAGHPDPTVEGLLAQVAGLALSIEILCEALVQGVAE